MEIDLFIFLIAYVIALGFGFIIAYRLLFWKIKVFILDRYEKTYFLLKTKTLYSFKNDVTIDNNTYILDRPTYFSGNKRIFFFERGNARPLSFIEGDTIDTRKLNILLNAKIIEQLARGVKTPSIDFKSIMYIVIIAIVIIAFFYFMPYILGPSTSTVTSTTTATPISPITP
jgi:hypothetical protein